MRVRLVWSGPGRGHESRARAVGQALVASGHSIADDDHGCDWEVLDCAFSCQPEAPVAKRRLLVIDRTTIDEIIRRSSYRVITGACVYKPRNQSLAEPPNPDACFPNVMRADLWVIPSSTLRQLADRGINLPPRSLVGPEYMPLRPEFEGLFALTTKQGMVDIRGAVDFTPKRLADLVEQSALVITSGGVRAMECASLGTAAVYVVESEDQRDQVDMLCAAGAGIEADPDEAWAFAKELLSDAARLVAMGEAGRRLVDGRGTYRIVKAMEEMQ